MDHNVHGTHSLNRYNFLFVPAIYRFGGQRIHLGPIELGPKAANIPWNPLEVCWSCKNNMRHSFICKSSTYVPWIQISEFVKLLVPASFQHFKLHRYQFPGYLGITVVCGQTTEEFPWWRGFQGMCPLRTWFFKCFFLQNFGEVS